MSHRSFSAVKTLRSCGEQYRLERVERVSQRPMAAGVAGRVIHLATELVDLEIESGERDEGTLTLLGHQHAAEVLDKEISDTATEEYPPEAWRAFGQSKNNPRGQDIEWFRRVGIPGAVANYINWRLENDHLAVMTLPSGVLAIEVPFEMQLSSDESPIRGQIDRVFTNVNNGLHLIVDLKSGLKPTSSEQLGVYRQAMLAGLPDEIFDYGAYIFGMKPTSKTGIRMTPDINLKIWTAERLRKIYGQADVIIEKELFLPNPGPSCFLCGVSQHCGFYAGSVL